MEDVLKRNAASALQQILDVRPEESFLVIGDEATLEVGTAFRDAAMELGVRTMFYQLSETNRPLADVPEDLMLLIPDTDVAVTCFSARPEETPFRVALIRELTRVVRRLAHCPGITVDMLRSGPMSVNYEDLAVRANSLMRRFEGAVSIHVVAPGGTDLTLDTTDRPFLTDAVIKDGSWGNLPAGEVWCAPVEDKANGVVVCDGAVGDLGPVPCPVRIVVEAGRIREIACDDAAFRQRIEEVLSVDEEAKVIGELGIGLNPGARLTGNLLEDEKAAGTAHVAFGNNEDVGGGRNRSRTHRDFLFRNPTITVTFADGRSEVILQDGQVTRATRPQAGYRHVLVCLDFSEASLTALRIGNDLARANGARFTLLHALYNPTPVSPLFPHLASMPAPELLRREEDETLERMDALAEEVAGRGPDEFEAVVVRGSPAQEIVRWANENDVDLIVLASTGTSQVERLLLGSVAEGVAREARCQVVLVR